MSKWIMFLFLFTAELFAAPRAGALAPRAEPSVNGVRDPITRPSIRENRDTVIEDETVNVGTGSGDDVDTVDEGDPANDVDPEVEEDRAGNNN